MRSDARINSSIVVDLSRENIQAAAPTIQCKLSATAIREKDTNEGGDFYFATFTGGLGVVLAKELRSAHIDSDVLHVAAFGVRFRSNVNDALVVFYACFCLRVNTRVLHQLFTVSIPVAPANMQTRLSHDTAYYAVKDPLDWPALPTGAGATLIVQVRLSLQHDGNAQAS